MSAWRAALHSFQRNEQRYVLHACHVVQLVFCAVAFVCAWWLRSEFVPFDYAVPLYLRDSTAKRRFDSVEAARIDSVAGVSLLDAELRSSVSVSQGGKRLGSPLQLELVYISRTNNIFTAENLGAIKSLEDKIRTHGKYPQFCARDWTDAQLLNASKITTDDPARDAMNGKLPACKTMLTALQSCADKESYAGTCGAASVASLPAGLLDCKKQTSASCAFEDMTLDMDFVNARLEAYSRKDPGPNASSAINSFYRYPSDNFGSSVAESAALRSTFTFALPLEGYLNSQDRPQEQEDKLWSFVYESYHDAVLDANKGDLQAYYSCSWPDACARLHLVANSYFDGLLIVLGLGVLMVFVAVRQASWIIGVNTLFHICATFAGSYITYFIWQQQTFGLFSIISVFCVVIAVMGDTALMADLWRGAAAAGAGGWTGFHFDEAKAKAAKHQQRTLVGTRALPLMGSGAFVSFGVALSCMASDFPAVQSFGLFTAAIAVVNFLCSAVTLPAAIAVAYQDLGYFPFCGCLGGVTAPRPPSESDRRVAPSDGGDDNNNTMAVVVVSKKMKNVDNDAVVSFENQFPPPPSNDDPALSYDLAGSLADLTDPAARSAAREVFDEARKEREAAEAARAEAANRAAEAEAESRRMERQVAEAEAELAAMNASKAAIRADAMKVSPEVQATIDREMITNQFLKEEETRAKAAVEAGARRRTEAAALQTRLETEMRSARAATEQAAKDAAAAKARAEVMAATSAASVPAPVMESVAVEEEHPIPGSLRAGAAVGSRGSKRPARPARRSDAAGPVTEAVQPDTNYPDYPQKPPGKGGNKGEQDSFMVEAMARMHKAAADSILATSGGGGDSPATFGAVYAALLDRFKWGVVIAIAVCVGVLLSTAIAVDADVRPPHLLPSGDNFREVHAARSPFYSRGGSSGGAMRMRLVWGIDPVKLVDRREYPRVTNPTKVGDVGDAVFANATRMSVGAKCFLDLCSKAETKDSPRATGGVSAGYTADCWMRDFQRYVDSVAGTSDQCGHVFAAWGNMTGCPSSCDCTAGYGISNGDGDGTNRGCRLQIEAQEKKWWEAMYAFLRDVPGNSDRYSMKVLGWELSPGRDHQRIKEMLREVRQCPSDSTGALHWRYTHADIPLTSSDNVPATTGLQMERAWEAWWAARYADPAGECRKVSALWPGFAYTPQTEAWAWEGTSPGDWFNAMDAVMFDVTKVVCIAHIAVAALVMVVTRSLPLGLIAAASTAVCEAWMVSFVVLRGSKLGAVEAIILCITPAVTAASLTHAAVAYAACSLPARGARVRAMLLEAGAAPLTAAVATMCATGAPMWGLTEPVKEAAVYVFVLAFGIIAASAVFAGIVAATRPGHGILGNCVAGEMFEDRTSWVWTGRHRPVQGQGQEQEQNAMAVLPAPEQRDGRTRPPQPEMMALPAPGDQHHEDNAVKPFAN
mmetsp:Transcript_28613/g.70547  ORF Transcript_28613/g.70547 Transcript_28613/m.70547 type:complete len:1443 (+) Transcript_28613:253-4581(+)